MFEKEAEEYAIDNYENCLYDDFPYTNDSRARQQSFKDGAEFGYNKAFVEADKNLKAIVTDFNKANKWHDLQKNPKDLPEPHSTVLDECGDKITYRGGDMWTVYSEYYEKGIDAEPPKAWCEIPTFKE